MPWGVSVGVGVNVEVGIIVNVAVGIFVGLEVQAVRVKTNIIKPRNVLFIITFP